MADYRVYFLDADSQHIVGARPFQAPDDETAASIAAHMRGLWPLELWREERRIRRWEAFPKLVR